MTAQRDTFLLSTHTSEALQVIDSVFYFFDTGKQSQVLSSAFLWILVVYVLTSSEYEFCPTCAFM